jgi:FkbM family methyltransferase
MRIKNRIKKVVSKLLGNRALQNANDPLSEVRSMTRYMKGVYNLGGRTIEFPDGPSFASMYDEIFRNEIYHFASDSTKPFIIDCGANVGISILYFKQIYPNSKVIAFEPDPAIFDYLSKNIHHFGHRDVLLLNKGVWKEDTEIIFNSEGADAGRIIDQDDHYHTHTKVQVVRLSEFINEKVDLLKIDIEGAEVEVVKEISHKLFHVRNIFIEFHSYIHKPQELNKILEILSIHGFRYYIDSPSRLRKKPFVDKFEYHSMDFMLNIFATKD